MLRLWGLGRLQGVWLCLGAIDLGRLLDGRCGMCRGRGRGMAKRCGRRLRMRVLRLELGMVDGMGSREWDGRMGSVEDGMMMVRRNRLLMLG